MVATATLSSSPAAPAAIEWRASELEPTRRWSRLQIGKLIIDRSFVVGNGLVIAAAVLVAGQLQLEPAAIVAAYIACVVFQPISSLIHEAGHGLAATALGYRLNYLHLSFRSCGVDWSREDGTAEPRDVMWIALAGPGANLAVGALAFAMASATGTSPILLAVIVVSVLQALANLAPRVSGDEPHPTTGGGQPSDGFVAHWALTSAAAMAESTNAAPVHI